ncbi:MAG: F0F1 ATP synthase subunit B [Balneolaceae bacterium]
MMTVFLAGGGILSFNTGFAIWVLISMLIFLWLMGKYAVPPIVKALNDREKRIKESLESAENAIAKAERIAKDNKKAMREAEVKAQQIRKKALEEAEILRSERIEKAKEEASRLLEDARNTIEQEKKRALLELRNEVADLAVQSASIILDAELDKEKNRKLVDDYIHKLSEDELGG